MARHDRRPERLDLIVRNGTLVIPGVGQIEADVGMAEGKIAALGDGLSDAAAEVYDAAGRAVLPGIFDPHIHLGDEQSYESEAETETRAAVLGGVTTVGIFLRSLEDSYFRPTNSEELENASINGMVKRISQENDDKFSHYFDPAAYKRFQASTSGEFSGIGVTVSANLSHLVVFTNGTRDFVAVEPVSHANNALNLMSQGHGADRLGVRILAPGQSLTAQMRIAISATR